MRFLKYFTTNKEVLKDWFASPRVILEQYFVFLWDMYMLILLLLISRLNIQSTFGTNTLSENAGVFYEDLTEFSFYTAE